MCHQMCHIKRCCLWTCASFAIRACSNPWLRAGKTIELRERGKVIARIVPEPATVKPIEWPDFAARRAKIFGKRVLPGADIVIAEREQARY